MKQEHMMTSSLLRWSSDVNNDVSHHALLSETMPDSQPQPAPVHVIHCKLIHTLCADLGVRLQSCNLSAVSIKVVDRLTFPDIRPTAFHVGFHWLDSEDHGNDGNRETKTEDQLIKERCPSGGHPEGR